MVSVKKVTGSNFFKGTILFLSYLLTAYLGLSLDAVGGFATLVWAPTGISLAFLLIYGTKLWPAIFLAAFFINLYFGANYLAAIGIALGNTLEAVAAVFLLKKYHLDARLLELEDTVKFIVISGLIATLVSASIGTFSLWATGEIGRELLQPTWLAWWVGDMLGNLVIAPLLIVWLQNSTLKVERKRLVEFGLWLVLTVFIGVMLMGNILGNTYMNSPFSYFIFPPLIWGALRFSRPVVLTITLLVTILSIWFTTLGKGPFIRPDLSESLLLLQMFIAVVSVTIFIMATIVQEARLSEEEISRLNKKLSVNIEKEAALNRLLATKISHKNKLDIK
jgi:integral membrane sensor domain MASE1